MQWPLSAGRLNGEDESAELHGMALLCLGVPPVHAQGTDRMA
jgi:hypothetical protein